MGVLEVVRKNLDWGVKVLGDMISIPTVNPPGEKYREFADYARDVLRSLGFDVQVIEVSADYVRRYYPDYVGYSRYIVYGRYGTGRPVLHFNGHYDVVPAGSGWTKDPFKPTIENGKVYGRGASDMKGGIAAFLVAAKSVIESGLRIKGSIEVALVPDEEIGGETGTGYLLRELKVRPNYVVIAEPSGSKTVWIGHKGAVWALVEVYGRQAHGSTPWLGINAFEYMVEIANRVIKEYVSALESRKSIYEYDDPRGARPTAMVGGEVKGGAKVNVVPGYYSFSIDRRVVPEERLEDVEREITEFIEKVAAEYKEVKVGVKIVNRLPPALTDPNSDFVKLVRSATKDILGQEPKTTVCLGGLDMRYYTELQIPTVTYGPGLLGVAHIADEYIPLSELEAMSAVYYALIEKALL